MDPKYEDLTLECIDPKCENGNQFVFEAGEQKFLSDLVAQGKVGRDGLPMVYVKPRRCKPCRERRKAEKAKL